MLIDTLRHHFPDCNMKKKRFSLKDTPYINGDKFLSISGHITDKEIEKLTASAITLIKTHRLPDFLEPYQFLSPISKERCEIAEYLQKEALKIYIYRNVKNVMLSLYYFVPQKERGRNIHDFIRQTRGKRAFSRIAFWAYHVAEWLKCEDALILNYDNVLRNTEYELEKVGAYIGKKPLKKIPLIPKPPKSKIARRLATFLSTCPSSSAIMSFEKRKYNVESFTREDEEYIEMQIKQIAPELIEMGIYTG